MGNTVNSKDMLREKPEELKITRQCMATEMVQEV